LQKNEFGEIDNGVMSIAPSDGVVTLRAINLISAIKQQAKSLKPHASAFAVIGEFRSI
jgi:hypothetical protein